MRLRWLLAAAVLAPTAVFAETVYVIDRLTVPLRAEPTATAAILATADTGDALEVIGRDGVSVQVRDSHGVEGWIEASLLLPQPPAAAPLKLLRAELERTRTQLVAAQALIDQGHMTTAPSTEALQEELTAARAQLARTRAELTQRDMALAGASPGVVPPVPTAPAASRFSLIWLIASFAMLVIGFIGGVIWVRESIRRRMGGMYLRI
ncbi:MAG: SH3 domain-containing protein [Gammaproteobacteria bacterium]|nr:SH3 domain-containing protein [Gammaproteobacteria bacterium]